MQRTTSTDLKRIWDRFLRDTEKFEIGEVLGTELQMKRAEAGLGDPTESDFRMDGELKGESSIGRTIPAESEPAAGHKMPGFFEPDTAGEGIEDNVMLDDSDRWSHERDEFIADQDAQMRAGFGGRNPRGSYLYSCSHERTERVRKLRHWIQTAPLQAVLRARRDKTLRVRRNESIAKTLGFSSVPKGPWPGVEWSDEHKALIRRYRCPETGAEVTRVGDFSRVYLTKAQLRELEKLMDKRCHVYLETGYR